jgi:hypothetical protein
MRTVAGTMRIARRTGQACVERVPFFSVSVLMMASAAAVVRVVSVTKKETGAWAPVSFSVNLLLAFLLASLALSGLARRSGLQSLVGLIPGLATSTA